jgi:hypothetical protein
VLSQYTLFALRNRCVDKSLSVIAIHGLGGHPFKTWTEKDRKKLWLRDYLPKDLPTARIYSYGYISGVAFTRTESDIGDFATDLLGELKRVRRQTKDEDVSLIPSRQTKINGLQ